MEDGNYKQSRSADKIIVGTVPKIPIEHIVDKYIPDNWKLIIHRSQVKYKLKRPFVDNKPDNKTCMKTQIHYYPIEQELDNKDHLVR